MVLTPSQWVADRVGEQLGVPDDRIRVVGPAVTASTASAMSSWAGDAVANRRLLVFPAITHPHKNHRVLIGAMAEIARQCPEALLVLTGGVGAADRAVREAMAAVDPDGSHIQHWGRISSPQLRAVMSQAELLVLPSRYEGFGIPVVEAMAHGTAVVASASTCLPEVVGNAGRLVTDDDVDAWADAILDLLNDSQERARLAAAGLIRAEHWSPPVAAARLVDAWESAIEGRDS